MILAPGIEDKDLKDCKDVLQSLENYSSSDRDAYSYFQCIRQYDLWVTSTNDSMANQLWFQGFKTGEVIKSTVVTRHTWKMNDHSFKNLVNVVTVIT